MKPPGLSQATVKAMTPDELVQVGAVIIEPGVDIARRPRFQGARHAQAVHRDMGEAHAGQPREVGLPVEMPRQAEASHQEVVQVPEPESGVELQELENILKQPAEPLKPTEIDAYWDALVETGPAAPTSLDELTYDQASRLGLAPEEPDKK